MAQNKLLVFSKESVINLATLHREHLLPTTGLKDPTLLKARLIGQERSGGILFTWSIPGDAGTKAKVDGEEIESGGETYVGWYVFGTNSFINLYK